MPNFSSDEDDETQKEDEMPTVVVLKEGDLTAEEAKSEQKHIDEGIHIFMIFFLWYYKAVSIESTIFKKRPGL